MPSHTAVIDEFGLTGAFAPNADLYPVKVLNLWEPGDIEQSGYQRQDQLVLDPPASTPEQRRHLRAVEYGYRRPGLRLPGGWAAFIPPSLVIAPLAPWLLPLLLKRRGPGRGEV